MSNSGKTTSARHSAPRITPRQLHARLQEPGELALLDVREYSEFSSRHLLYAVPAPLWRIELLIHRQVPRKVTPIVLVDADGTLLDEAAGLLARLGYTRAIGLDGGIEAWATAGYEVFSGVNVPSKAFGEVVEIQADTPHISAPQLHERLQRGEALVVVDGRTPEEFFRFSIPGAYNLPNAELPYRIRELAPDPRTPIVVNCAGRTRSIIGAQTLIDAGIPNPVVSLKDGTMAWLMHGYSLAQGRRTSLPQPSPAHLRDAREQAGKLLQRVGVKTLAPAALQALLQDDERTTYLFDIRSREEYRAGHLPGWRWAPGGQLIQATDDYLATQGATIVLADWDGVRAATVAAWLVQLGKHTVYVYRPENVGALETGDEPVQVLRDPASGDAAWISAEETLQEQERGNVLLVDVDSPADYARRHIRHAWYAVAQDIAPSLPALELGARTLVITSADGILADSVARRLRSRGISARALLGGNRAWFGAGYPTDSGSERDLSEEKFPWRHAYDYTDEALRNRKFREYLEWEVDLAEQVRRPGGEAPFSVLAA